MAEHFDVLIVGAGLSGISAAYYLQTRCPTKRFMILESRSAIGGTWDLFHYPGVRSDSDMHTLGFSFRPWRETKTIADGPSILKYIRETAQEFGIDRKIRFNHQVQRAEWSSAEARWMVEAECGPDREVIQFTCSFLYMCSGYYDYAQGFTPTWPDIECYTGRIVHPQQWPDDLDYAGKRVVVIGSGATAVTLVPAIAQQAAHVTMLQRSPTYMISLPSQDAYTSWLYQRLPDRPAYQFARWKSILLGMAFYTYARRRPVAARRLLLQQVRDQLGPGYDVEKSFAPRYNPWDQRLCVVPDADLFTAIKSGAVNLVTGQIERFTKTGIRLSSGEELDADVIVTATGLALKLLGGVQLSVDGVPVDPAKTLTYKGCMVSNIPNLASAFGYTNASWTLKCELIAGYVCRLLYYMDQHGYAQCTPRPQNVLFTQEPVLNLTSGYVQRAMDKLPRQGSKKPWKMYQNYLLDLFGLRFSRVRDGTLEFTRLKQPESQQAQRGRG